MASLQRTKPVQQTTVVWHNTTTDVHKEHSLTDKVKGAAHSAIKIFEHQNQQNSGQHCHLTQKPHGVAAGCACAHCSHKKEEGHGGFVHNLGEQIKNLTSKKKHRKNRPPGSHRNDDSSSDSSSDESDVEICLKKNCV